MERTTEPGLQSRWAGVIALVACAALWSLNGPLIKLLHRSEVPGITIACYRSLIGGLAFLPLAWPRRATVQKVPWYWPAATILMFTVMTASFVIANTRTAASNAIVLQYTSPLWVFLLSPLVLRERASLGEGAVMLLAMVGVAVIFLGNPPADLPGLYWALLSGWGYGTLTVLLRKLKPVRPTVVAALNASGSGLLLLVPAFYWGRLQLDGSELAILLVLALVQFTFPYFLFSWALQRVAAQKAALLLLLEVILNPLWTLLAVGEVPPRATLVGGPLILAGIGGAIVVGWNRKP